MNFWPLVECELRVALRRPSTRHFRLACALSAMALAGWILFVWSAWQPLAALGKSFFNLLSAVGFGGALLAGFLLAADAVSQEKREGTLALLFLTDLTPPDVVLGKLVAKAVLPLYGLLALVPTLMMAVLVGGNTASEFVRMFLAWANALLLSLAICLWTSTYFWRQRSSHLAGGFALLLLTAVVPYLGNRLAAATRNTVWWHFALLLSPTGPYCLAGARLYGASGIWFWVSLLMNQVGTWILLGLTALKVLQCRFDETGPKRAPPPDNQPAIRVRDRHQKELALLAERPMEWLHARRSHHRLLSWLAVALVAGCFLGLPPDFLNRTRGLLILVFVIAGQLALRLWVSAYAAFAFAADRRTGALESLLGTRIEVPEIASGVFRGSARRFFGPLAVSTMLCLALALRAALVDSGATALTLGLSAAVTLWDSYCLFWVGLYQGLAARTPAIGFMASLCRILLLPWAWFFVSAQLLSRSAMPLVQVPLVQLVVLWIIIVVINHIVFLANARVSFRRYFRVLALKPFGEKNPHIESDWSPINWDEELNPGEPA
jgi:hypothetical protein